MANVLGIDQAIGWAHWKVRGGFKAASQRTLMYSILAVALIMLTWRFDPLRTQQMLAAWRGILLAIESAVLVLMAGSAINSAVRSDFTSGMMESHRLMPVAPLTAITGYIWGPALPSVFLASGAFILGLAVTMTGGMSPIAWLLPSFVMFTFAIFCWVVTVYISMITRAAAMYFGIIISLLVATQGLWLLIIPGTLLLTTPAMHRTVFTATVMDPDLNVLLGEGLFCQAMIGSILFIGASRRYRRDSDSALGVTLGLILLLMWVMMSMVAMMQWEELSPFGFRSNDFPDEGRLLGSIFSSMALGIIPVANSARQYAHSARPIIVALACATLILPLTLLGEKAASFHEAIVSTAVVLICFFVTISYLLRIVYRITPRGWPFMIGWLMASNALPLIGDLFYWGFVGLNESFNPSIITCFSPIGAIVSAWTGQPTYLQNGVVVQVIITALSAIVYHATNRRRKSSPAEIAAV